MKTERKKREEEEEQMVGRSARRAVGPVKRLPSWCEPPAAGDRRNGWTYLAQCSKRTATQTFTLQRDLMTSEVIRGTLMVCAPPPPHTYMSHLPKNSVSSKSCYKILSFRWISFSLTKLDFQFHNASISCVRQKPFHSNYFHSNQIFGAQR